MAFFKFHYFLSKLDITTPLVNGLYLIHVSSCNLHVDDVVKKGKQNANEAFL